jgi:AraC family transcriptional regulator
MRRENALYGRELGRRFHLEAAPAFVTQTLKSSGIAVTSMRLTRRNSEITEPLPVEDAHIVALPYEACDDHEIWLEGKCIDSEPFRAGVTTFYDLRRARGPFCAIRTTSTCFICRVQLSMRSPTTPAFRASAISGNPMAWAQMTL